MSYLIAFVRFDNIGRSYPVNCHREDIATGDQVLVSMPERYPPVKAAIVERLDYLGWNCRNTILCQTYEATFSPCGQWALTNPNPNASEVTTWKHLAPMLHSLEWKSGLPVTSTFQRAYWYSNDQATAYVLTRRHGLDLQLFDEVDDPPQRHDGKVHVRTTFKQMVRHWHYRSEVNIYELAVAFALAFQESGSDLSFYFKSQGHKPPRPIRDEDEISQIRDAVGVDYSGRAYLSDGVWL